MNKDKTIKDLRERNDKLANQYRLRDIRCVHLEQVNQQLKDKISKAIKYIEEHSTESELKIYGIPKCKIFKGSIEELLDLLEGREE